MIRLNKLLAQCGLGSRRKCDQLIQTGKIAVNGKIVTTLGLLVDENEDTIFFDEKILTPENTAVYILLNKPIGYVTTLNDEKGRKKVSDLIPIKQRIFPVGRLDIDTEGLLLLTNDGNLCYQLTHPKFLVDKVYMVKINQSIQAKDIQKLERGIMLETGITAPCKIQLHTADKTRRTLNVILHEGKKRQVRRMFEALGYSVRYLVRTKFANLTLNNLPVGKWRYLTGKEITKLTRTFKSKKNI